ncbi:sister chromatid cohesion protein SCC2-like [Elaeis guineensis]|uniref:sister chromatid cohesion protein SCC2-like n=1 Tax=Elaeis guineensis var. tenera TaxID=51953 RepID=UPI003C6DAF33
MISKQNISFNIHDAPANLPTSYEYMVQKYRIALCRSSSGCFRKDAINYAPCTANVKRKRPTPKSLRDGKGLWDKGEDDEHGQDDNDDWTGGP